MFSILGGPMVPTKESITEKTNVALGGFRTAISLLEESNTEAHNLAVTNQDIIDSLTAENLELETITGDNDNVIQKIKALIS